MIARGRGRRISAPGRREAEPEGVGLLFTSSTVTGDTYNNKERDMSHLANAEIV